MMSVGFLPGIGSMKTFACFRDTGQCSNLAIALNVWRRVFRLSGGSSCIIRAVIRSEPGALGGCSCLIACLSSLIVKARSFSEHRVWVASCRSTSGSRVSSCGVQTSARWRANRSTFSVSHFGQEPGV